MSGGVDSAAAALLLKNKGYDVVGVTMLLSGNERDAADAEKVCRTIGIPHITLDLKKKFTELVEIPFCDSYLNGETPNPCVICNKRIKFGALSEYAAKNGFDRMATGHYASKGVLNGHTVIRRASDEKKDQSYMLWQLSEEQISRTEFPLAELTKTQVRQLTEKYSLPNSDKSDSQDICFVPDGDYVSFIKNMTGYIPQCGNYTDISGNIIGKHCGHICYTVGQRKGLGVAFGEPRYVQSKDAASNTVVLGTDDELYTNELTIHGINLMPSIKLPNKFDVKIRYAHKAQPAIAEDIDNGRLRISFETPQRAPAKGQSAVMYLGDLLVGGGFIE